MGHGGGATVWQKPTVGGAGVAACRRCLREEDMLIKLRLNGEEYHALLGAPQDDKNHYMKKDVHCPTRPKRVPFIKIVSAKSFDGRHAEGPLVDHNVTLEVQEWVWGAVDDRGPTPLSVLKHIFDAVDLYPDEVPDEVPEAGGGEDNEAQEQEAS